MKLITHNMLTSRCLKNVTVGYPLKIIAKQVKVQETEFNPDFVVRVIPKLDWNAFRTAADSLGYGGDLPQELGSDFENDQELLKKVHHALLEVEVVNGELVCPESGRKFPISEGIPNMLLNEDEL